MSVVRVTIGFRLHTGWAALVAVAGAPDNLMVKLRKRIELLPPDGSIPRFVYHKAAEMADTDAAELVQHAAAEAGRTARSALGAVVEELGQMGMSVTASGI